MKMTKSEEQLMEIFWKESKALTSNDIVDMNIKKTWGAGLVQNMIRSLIKKGLLKTCGLKQYGTQYARELMPAMNKETYVAQLVMDTGIARNSLTKVMAALAEEADNKEEVINQLEDIIKQLKEER